MLAYNYSTHCGLITFNSSPKLEMKISHVMENFRRATQGMKANGDTSLWDALALGKDQLVEYGKKYPDGKIPLVITPKRLNLERLCHSQFHVSSLRLGMGSKNGHVTFAYSESAPFIP